jgi:D-serine deaminase-like pyridoxal phosphate-dependent protein
VHAQPERRVKVGELATPALLVEASALEHNLRP